MSDTMASTTHESNRTSSSFYLYVPNSEHNVRQFSIDINMVGPKINSAIKSVTAGSQRSLVLLATFAHQTTVMFLQSSWRLYKKLQSI